MSDGHAHETKRDEAAERHGPPTPERRDRPDAAAEFRGTLSTLSPAGVSAAQRAAGNRAVLRALRAERLAVQRHPEGAALPTKEEDAAEVNEAKSGKASTPAPEETATPEGQGASGETTETLPTPEPEGPPKQTARSGTPLPATRSKKEEKKEKGDARKAGSAFTKQQKGKLTSGAMSLAGAQSVLQGSFGGVKTVVQGTIVILADQAACSRKYDEVSIREGIKRDDGSDWQMGDCAKDDAKAGVLTQGFADDPTIYVNGKSGLHTVTAHEMLHINTVAGFRDKVGETFNEGATEYLALKACKAAGAKAGDEVAYPTQVKLTKKLIDFVGEDKLIEGYFSNPDTLVNAFTAKSATSWDDFKAAAEALDEDKVKKALKKKKKK